MLKISNKDDRKQTLEPLAPGILGPSSSTKLEKILNYRIKVLQLKVKNY